MEYNMHNKSENKSLGQNNKVKETPVVIESHTVLSIDGNITINIMHKTNLKKDTFFCSKCFFSNPEKVPTKATDNVKPGKYPKGEKKFAPIISATIPVIAPAIGPNKRPARIMGVSPKLSLIEFTPRNGIIINRNLVSTMLIAASSAIVSNALVLNFNFIFLLLS